MPITMSDCRIVELLTVRVPNADSAPAVDGKPATGEGRRTACSGAVLRLSLVSASRCGEPWRDHWFVFAYGSSVGP
jgi:hypothetical protein